jgi:hypothetical protein
VASKEDALAELYEQLKDWTISDKKFEQILERIRKLEGNS